MEGNSKVTPNGEGEVADKSKPDEIDDDSGLEPVIDPQQQHHIHDEITTSAETKGTDSNAKEINQETTLVAVVDDDDDDDDDDGTDNPQDATIEPGVVDFDVTVHDDSMLEEEVMEANNPNNNSPRTSDPVLSTQESDATPPQTTNAPSPKEVRRKRRSKQGRRVHIQEAAAMITKRRTAASGSTTSVTARPKPGLSLPPQQYEVILVRRAVRKRQDGAENNNNNDPRDNAKNMDGSLEVYGDTSLGMKLTIVSAKVIVQSLNALEDGRASPAQLTGLIKRGDVLLSINGGSLVNLPIDQLMSRLGPLSTPDANGVYQRHLSLRLQAAGGIDLLLKSEGSVAKQQFADDPVGDMFSLFPMVDQLSGVPLVDEHLASLPLSPIRKPAADDDKVASPGFKSPEKKPPSIDEEISLSLAAVKQRERNLAMSQFFTWSNDYSRLMRCDSSVMSSGSVQSSSAEASSITKEMFVQRAHRAIIGASALVTQMESVDKGSDVRSFQSWNTTLSLYSRASTRRRYVLDAASLPLNFGKFKEEEKEDDSDEDDDSGGDGGGSLASNASGEEQLDGDELLLRLAAQDEIWRKQVVEFLQDIVDGKLEAREEVPEHEVAVEESPETNDFSSFLLGENISKILTQRKKSMALPPSDVTAVLFDLTTKISASVPDEITAAGTHVSIRSSMVPFMARKAPAPGSQVMLATQFLVDEVLPIWIKTFRPLPWDQRRVLWPLDKQSVGGSTAASTVSDDDSLTLDSYSTGINSASKMQRSRRNLREQIEDQELDQETREETCFLLTYFFTQALLPRLKESGTGPETQIRDFVKKFGSYLRLHTCLAYAIVLKAERVIDILLDLARNDPKHRDVIKRTSKSTSLLFYEPTMLSGVVQRLRNLQMESSPEVRQATIDLCASAYPDIQPWQLQRQCLRVSGANEETKALADLYYVYLTLLLHPVDGHGKARQDRKLVSDWCDLSVQRLKHDGRKKSTEYRANFMGVASRATSSHTAYSRDLVNLLKLSMEIDDVDLALDLATEIVDHPDLSQKTDALTQVVEQVRLVAHRSLKPGESIGTRSMKRILKLFRKASQSRSAAVRETFNVPAEILSFIRYRVPDWSDIGDVGFPTEQLDLIRFLADWAEPDHLLQALSCLTEVSGYHNAVVPIGRTLLRRAAHESVSSEMSVALLKVKHARMEIEQGIDSSQEGAPDSPASATSASIWQNMSNGMITIAK